MSKRYLNNLDILIHEKDKVASNNIADNCENEIRYLKRRINR